MDIEKEILSTVKDSIAKAIGESLNRYNGPIPKVCEQVMSKHEDEIRDIFESAISGLVGSADFKNQVIEAMNHKMARVLVSKLEGSIEKSVNSMRQDPTLRAKMVIAIEQIIKESQSAN